MKSAFDFSESEFTIDDMDDDEGGICSGRQAGVVSRVPQLNVVDS